MIRKRFFPLIWRLLWPLRFFVTRSPFRLGKRFTQRALIEPLLPPAPHTFLAKLPLGAEIRLQYREDIGLCTLLDGQFEAAEIETLCSYARRDTIAIDVGSNVGVYAVVLAAAIGPKGRVFAFEPAQPNVQRLRNNLELNGLSNVVVFPIAVGEKSESVILHLSNDPAYHSTRDLLGERALGRSITITGSSLDREWTEMRSPDVSVVKIDVEGAELSVLQGAREILGRCQPTLLVEITTEQQLTEISEFLAPYDYRSEQPRSFMRWNYLFVPNN